MDSLIHWKYLVEDVQYISLDGGAVFHQGILGGPGIGFGAIHQQVGGSAIRAFKHSKES